MKKILLSILLISASLYALEVQNTTVKFTAFKTYAKIGVSGVFDKVDVNMNTGDTVETLLKNATANIDTSSVNSGNEERDMKLVKKFFDVQNITNIQAKIIDVTDNTLVLKLTMNLRTLKIPMRYSDTNNTINAKGVIDLADFSMLKSLQSLNRACYVRHKGKTWQDVNIYFTMQYK